MFYVCSMYVYIIYHIASSTKCALSDTWTTKFVLLHIQWYVPNRCVIILTSNKIQLCKHHWFEIHRAFVLYSNLGWVGASTLSFLVNRTLNLRTRRIGKLNRSKLMKWELLWHSWTYIVNIGGWFSLCTT